MSGQTQQRPSKEIVTWGQANLQKSQAVDLKDIMY